VVNRKTTNHSVYTRPIRRIADASGSCNVPFRESPVLSSRAVTVPVAVSVDSEVLTEAHSSRIGGIQLSGPENRLSSHCPMGIGRLPVRVKSSAEPEPAENAAAASESESAADAADSDPSLLRRVRAPGPIPLAPLHWGSVRREDKLIF
jgi:hypothetical protein